MNNPRYPHHTKIRIIGDTGHLSNQDNLFTYERYLEKEQKIMEYKNKLLKDDEELNIFQGDIVFESGDSDTILSFQDVSKESSKKESVPILCRTCRRHRL